MSKVKQQKNWSLYLGLAIPLLMVLFIAVSIYLPRLLDNTPPPTFDFLYTSSTNYYYQNTLDVREGKLIWQKKENQNTKSDNEHNLPPKLYRYDVSEGISKEITFTEAEDFLIDSRNMAADGYEVTSSRNRGFFLFDWRSSYNWFLVNGHAAHKLNLHQDKIPYYRFNFLGWIVEQPTKE